MKFFLSWCSGCLAVFADVSALFLVRKKLLFLYCFPWLFISWKAMTQDQCQCLVQWFQTFLMP